MKIIFGLEQKLLKKKFYFSTMVKKCKIKTLSFLAYRHLFFKKKIFKFILCNKKWRLAFYMHKNSRRIRKKIKNFAHHYEYEESGLKY